MLATGYAVVAGIAYNFLPFTALPLYVALERIDKRVVEAADDLYATRREAFLQGDPPARRSRASSRRSCSPSSRPSATT